MSLKNQVTITHKITSNPSSTVYLRCSERDLGVSSNTVRTELNKLSEMQLIKKES